MLTTARKPTSARKAKRTIDIYRKGETTLEIRFLVSIALFARSFRNEVDDALRAIGQSATRMEALGAITNMQGSVSQRDLAQRLRLENPTITRIIDILSAEGLVTRSPDPRDRRINLLNVSEDGQRALEGIFDVYDEMRERVLEGVSEQELRDTIGLIERMTARLADSHSR